LSRSPTLFAHSYAFTCNADDGCTALHLAAQHGHSDIILQLLAAGARLKTRTAEGFTPLMTAVVHLQAGSVRQLLAHGSNASAADNQGWRLLHRACASVVAKAPQIPIDMVVQLLAAGAHPNAKNAAVTAGADTPLSIAVQFGHTQIVVLLLKLAGADPDAANADGMTPLMVAVQTKQFDKLAALLEAGAAVNTANGEGVTCLMYASGLAPEVEDGCQMVDALLAAGATVAAADNSGCTALMYAAKSGGVAAVRSLLQAGAAVNTAAKDGTTCLIAACSRCCCGDQYSAAALPVVLQLLAAGADVNAAGKEGFRALMAAASCGSVEGVEALLKAGAAVNAATQQGVTALYCAIGLHKRSGPQHRYDQVVAQLLKAGADASAVWHMHYGSTPLHRAAKLGKCNIMRQLLAAGAQCNAITTAGELHCCATYASVGAPRTAATLCGCMLCWVTCNLFGAPRVWQHLVVQHTYLSAHAISAVALTCVLFLAGSPPLHFAAFEGQGEAIAVLLAAGAAVAFVNPSGHSCLSYAAQNGQTAAVRQLLQAWPEPAAAVLRHAVKLAVQRGHWDAAMLLVQPLGKQDMAAAAEVMRAMPGALPALLNAIMSSEEEQQEAALQDEFRQLAEQRRGLQVMALGFAGMCKRADAAGHLSKFNSD
jgi:ankyrin repeat protein